MSKNTVDNCEYCNSPIVKVKKGKRVTVECSYCGLPVDEGIDIEDFMPEYNGEE